MEQIQQYLDEEQYTQAEQLIHKSLISDPKNPQLLEYLGISQLEQGNVQAAVESFEKSIQMDHSKAAMSYLYLAQLSDGHDALQLYSQAREILLGSLKEMQITENEYDRGKEKYMKILCAMAELYMTDCCMEESAEVKCQNLVKEALELAPTNMDVMILQCNLLMCQCAKEKVVQILNVLVGSIDEKDPKTWMEMEQGLSVAKLLIECEMFEQGLTVLAMCQLEDDEEPQVWYLFGWIYYVTKEYEDSIECLERAKLLLGPEGGEVVEQIDSLLIEMNQMDENNENNEMIDEMDQEIN